MDLTEAMGKLWDLVRFDGASQSRSREAYNSVAMALVQREELLVACRLVEPAMASLIDELGGHGGADWGLVNDCLVDVGEAIRRAEGRKA